MISNPNRTNSWISAAVRIATCIVTLALAPFAIHVLGASLIAAIPLLVLAALIATRRLQRRSWKSSVLTGIAIGFSLIFAYAFSPPVLERIGHELGWPGRSLQLWERFTAPVYLNVCTNPWFWDVFVVWETWIKMLQWPSTFTAISSIPLIAAILIAARLLRRRHSSGEIQP